MKTVWVKLVEGKAELTNEGEGFPFILDVSALDDDSLERAKRADLLSDFDEFDHYCRTMPNDDEILMEAIKVLGECVILYGDRDTSEVKLSDKALQRLRDLSKA